MDMMTFICFATDCMKISVADVFGMIVRGIIIYAVGVVLARTNKKLIGIRTPFNFVLFVMLGSIFANAIVMKEFFIPILCTVFVLVLFNGAITALSFYFPNIENFIKGTSQILVIDGMVQQKAMRTNFITSQELMSELQKQLHTSDLSMIELALLSSDGTINFICKAGNSKS